MWSRKRCGICKAVEDCLFQLPTNHQHKSHSVFAHGLVKMGWPTVRSSPHWYLSSSVCVSWLLTLPLESHSPCCRGRWSWRCRPDQHQQKAGPPQQYVECSLHGPQGWSQGFCSAPDGCCLHPECSRGYRDRPGTPLRPCSQWSSLHQTDLGPEENRRIFNRYQTGHVWFCKLKVITYRSAKQCILWTLLLSQQPAHACFGSHGEPDRWH